MNIESIQSLIILFVAPICHSEEAIQSSGMPTNRSSIDMENVVFLKSNSRVSVILIRHIIISSLNEHQIYCYFINYIL